MCNELSAQLSSQSQLPLPPPNKQPMFLFCQQPVLGAISPHSTVPNFHVSRSTGFKLSSSSSTFHHNNIIRDLSLRPNPDGAFAAFVEMLLSDAQPNHYTFPFLLKSCSARHGRQAHAFLLKLGLSSDPFIHTSLVDLYARCLLLSDARRVFDLGPQCGAAPFTALMKGYLTSGQVDNARQLFDEIPVKDVVSWNAMISGFTRMGLISEALEVFNEMLVSGVLPNESTMVSVLSACAQGGVGNLGMGKWVHSWIEENYGDAFFSNLRLGNALVDMYAKCGQLNMARDLFDSIPRKDQVSWNVMIGGYSCSRHYMEALELFREMQVMSRVEPNAVTFLSVLPSCAYFGALDAGKWIHAYVERKIRNSSNHSLVSDPALLSLQACIINMYAKCGSIEFAEDLFNGLERRSLSSWNAMICGLAMHGHYEKVFHLFSRMTKEGYQPDEITFVGVLSACSHSGLVETGRKYFSSMINDHGIQPGLEHYGCMVNLLSRAGLLVEASNIIRQMGIHPDEAIWGSLLSACQTHRDVKLAEYAVDRLLELEPENIGARVILSNIYAAAGLWDAVAKIRTCLNDNGMKKLPGCTSIEVNGIVHEFLVGDRSHPNTKEVYHMLEEIETELEKAGYVSDTSEILYDVEDEWKEGILSYHSERLAIAFGLISTGPGIPIRIMKNLNVCRNCHSVSKLISKIYNREIIARDHNRFHHFKDGICSCKDYW